MIEKHEQDQVEPADNDLIVPKASTVPPNEGGFAPVKHREPIDDDGQRYTGHEAVDGSLGASPVRPRGEEKLRRGEG